MDQSLPISLGSEVAAADAVVALLASQGHCDARTVERGRRVAAENGQRLDRVLIQLGLVNERELARAYATLLGLLVAGADAYPAEPVLAELLSARFLRHARAMPLRRDADGLLLAVADPLDRFTPAAAAAAADCPVAIAVAVPIELEAAFDRLYPDRDAVVADQPEGGERLEEDAERLRDLASEAPVIRLVSAIINRAVETQASDIHIEPFEDRLRVRYRYDGVLHEADSPPVQQTAAIISRIKIMSRLDIAERRLPQDGRIKLAVRGQRSGFPRLHHPLAARRDRRAARARSQRGGARPRHARPGPRPSWQRLNNAPWSCRTASSW